MIALSNNLKNMYRLRVYVTKVNHGYFVSSEIDDTDYIAKDFKEVEVAFNECFVKWNKIQEAKKVK